MALIKCPECKKKISDVAEKCPNCGKTITEADIGSAYEQNKKWEKRKKIAIIITALLQSLIFIDFFQWRSSSIGYNLYPSVI